MILTRKQKIWAIFDYWYNKNGHWMFSDKQKAIDAWVKWGIDGLPDYPGVR